MKKNPLYLGVLLTALVLLASCSSKPDAPIPTDAAFVMHIDGNSISNKLPWSEIKKSAWFQLASENAEGDSLFTVILNDPAQSGLDLSGNGWAFVANRSKGAYSAFIWDLEDAKKFEALLKKSAPDAKIESKGSNRYVAENSMVLVWNDKKIMVLGDASGFNRDLNGLTGDESETPPGSEGTEGDEIPDISEEPFSLKKEDLIQVAEEIQGLKSGQKLSNDDKFADLIKTKGDVHFWFNAGKMYGNTLAGSLLSLSKLSTLLEGNIGTATVSFNAGAIDIESKNYVGKELEALYKKYQAANFNETALTNIPAGNMNMAFIMNYPPEGLKALLSLFGVDGLVNTFMQEAGFSVDEFIKANGGNLFFTLSDFQFKKVTKTFEGFEGELNTYEDSEPSGKLLFGAEVKERNAFQKMMDVAKKLLTTKGGMREEELKKVPYQLTDKWFLSGNDSAQMKNYGAKKTDHAFLDKIKGHPLGLYVNLSSFIKGAESEIGADVTSKGVYDLSVKFWKEIVMTGGEFKKGGSVSTIRLTLGEANTNSLKSLNQYFGQIAQLSKEQEALREKEWESVDSTIPAPAN